MKTLLSLLLIFYLAACSSKKADPGEILTLEVLQSNNMEQFAYGEERRMILHEMIEDKTEPLDFRMRLKRLYVNMSEADSLSGNCIAEIEKVKRRIFLDSGEELSPKKETSIIHYDFKKEPKVRPVSYDFANAKNYEGTSVLEENKNQIIQLMKELRRDLCTILEQTWITDETKQRFFFKDPEINKFSSRKDFHRQFDHGIKKSRISGDDIYPIREIYFLLSIPDEELQNILTHKDSWVEAMNILLSIENKILRARGLLLNQMLYGRIGCMGCYSFSHILPVVNGANAAIAGDTVKLQLLMAVHDEYKAPLITIHGGGRLVKNNNGIGEVEVIVPNAKEVELSGTITILNKSGIPKTLPWSHRIKVVSKK